jgi:RNA polymerase sigma-70 factor (ECF subfamily)
MPTAPDAPTAELADLVTRTAAGDRDAFRRLYRATSAKLFAVVLRIVVRRELAEEAMQEAYLKAWRMAPSWSALSGSPMAWLCTIARNAAIDVVRRADEKLVYRRVGPEQEADELVRIPDPVGDPETGDALRRLNVCLEALPADRRAMVLKAYLEGWSREDLAEAFARQVATVKTILRRALIQLKACMDA